MTIYMPITPSVLIKHHLSLFQSLHTMLRYSISAVLFLCLSLSILAQDQGLPNQMLPKELIKVDDYRESRSGASAGITTPPNFPVRTMAEWEEVQTLVLVAVLVTLANSS